MRTILSLFCQEDFPILALAASAWQKFLG